MATGIYGIRCSATGKWYVGAGIDAEKRVAYHFYAMKTWPHEKQMSEDAAKYGIESFEWCILENVSDISLLTKREQFWIDKLDSIKNGYNKQNSGRHHTWQIMAEFRTIHSKMWRDSWYAELDVDGKLLWVYLITNGAASLTGIYHLPVRIAAFETGMNQERVSTLLSQFVLSGKIEYENEIVWIRRMRKYQAANETSPKIAQRILKDLDEIPDCKVKRMYLGQYGINTVSIPTHTDTETDTDTETIGAKNAPEPSTQKATQKQTRERDLLFDAIAKVCCVDPSVKGNGASVGKVRAALLATEPPYTPAEVLAFGEWWHSDEWRSKKGPPTLWKLREQIGLIRNGNGRKPEPIEKPSKVYR